MPMKLKSTQFNLVNSKNEIRKESEEGSNTMEESGVYPLDDALDEFSPSDEVLCRIFDFAKSYQVIPGTRIKFFDIYMN